MTIHIMLDLETWGTRPGCDIRSIGACVFNPVTGDIGDTFYIATDNPRGFRGSYGRWFNKSDSWQTKYPLIRDPATVKWWNDQSEEAKTAFADPVDLKEALDRFTNWFWQATGETFGLAPDDPDKRARLWSHGPAFDPPILAEAYHACKLPVPWHYRAPRDTRTLFDLAGIDDHSAWLNQHPGPLGIPHHALDDAICQAQAVCAAYKRLRNLMCDQNVKVRIK